MAKQMDPLLKAEMEMRASRETYERELRRKSDAEKEQRRREEAESAKQTEAQRQAEIAREADHSRPARAAEVRRLFDAAALDTVAADLRAIAGLGDHQAFLSRLDQLTARLADLRAYAYMGVADALPALASQQ